MLQRLSILAVLLLGISLLVGLNLLAAQRKRNPEPIPHAQDRPPGPALSPAEALQKMRVPDGFSVELVASEPDLLNPVAMTFDEKGRIWVVESLEYPRLSAGPGKDRIKIFEDPDGDGKFDKMTVFAEGLNIPCGIAVGHGGVWVSNSPDILYYKIGPDGKAAGKPEVVVTGFGRTDTHELPNSLIWGPDGWLYGLNGVFNHSHVRHQGKEWKFTCALFRIHPRTHEFQLFCEGTSNPWGLAIDDNGSFFVSACVIDHLWHLTETGYYIRQGGPYPPFTQPMGSIVRHKHQKAAYCGLVWFDSDAYPPEYRGKLFMGNIHGGCINSDELTRDGSTYFAKPRPDFLTANDAWFMPVSQKVGPDGCLYVLDWYDRYHCYQDANRDPGGIDRKYGRLYRIRHKDSPRAAPFDLTRESEGQLIERLKSPNIFFRENAQRLLSERLNPALARVARRLETLVLDGSVSRKTRLHALWALIGAGPLEPEFHQQILTHDDPTFRAWGVRAAGNQGEITATLRDHILQKSTQDSSPEVLLQVAIAARKLRGVDAVPVLVEVLARAGDDKLLPHIIWQNLHPLLEERAIDFLTLLAEKPYTASTGRLLPLAAERILASAKPQPTALARLLALTSQGTAGAGRQVLTTLTSKIHNGEVPADQLPSLAELVLPVLRKDIDRKDSPMRLEAILLASSLKDAPAVRLTRELLAGKHSGEIRVRALETLLAIRDEGVLEHAGVLLGDRKGLTSSQRGQVLSALSRLEDDRLPAIVLARYEAMETDLQPRAVELLTQRPSWGKALLQAIAEKKLPASVLNLNQARRLLSSKDGELVQLVQKHYGIIRDGRNPAREKVVAEMRNLLSRTKGDPHRGNEVYKKLCAQCHKIHGEGVEVGPDITANGRADFEQLLSNVFDPSLVIGPGYQAVTIETKRGRSLTGLLVEDNATRVVLKIQGGKQEVVPAGEVESKVVSQLSLMPEDVEKQLKPQEIADLFAFLVLDRPPSDPRARRIAGTPKGL